MGAAFASGASVVGRAGEGAGVGAADDDVTDALLLGVVPASASPFVQPAEVSARAIVMTPVTVCLLLSLPARINSPPLPSKNIAL